MKGTLFSADFVKDSLGNLRLLEMNTDTGFIDQELINFNFDDFLNVLSQNSITVLDIIYKPFLHIDFVNKLSEEVSSKLPSVTSINLHDENLNSIYPTTITDTGNNFILRLAYDESAIFDSTYCKNRLNVYNLFNENTFSDQTVAYYHSSPSGTYDTLTREINPNNIPDLTVKDINESFNPIDFHKLNSTGNPTQDWDAFIAQNSSDDKLIEQYHFNTSELDGNNHITSVRFFGIVFGPNLDILPLHSYKISSIFELPNLIQLENDSTKLKDHHYYELTTNFIKSDSYGIFSQHEILMDSDVYKQISDVEVGDTVKSYLISGSPQNESDLNSLTWNYDGNQFPAGSYITSSNVVFKDVRQLEYGAMMEIVVDNDSLFSGINKKYLVFDTSSNKSSFKYTSELNAVTDLLYDLDGNMIQIDEVNFYVSDESNLNFVEIDVEDSDTYIINGSTAFNSVVSHNSPCFVAGTKILMKDGEMKNIEDVKIGDLIKSFDFEKNQVRVSEVAGIQSKNVGRIVEYVFSDGGTLKATFDHPLYVVDKGWCSFNESMSNLNYSIGAKVNKIEIGDFVKLIDKNIDLVEINIIDEETKVFNLKDVKSDHNYFANNVLVHNRACFISGTKIQMGDGSEKNIEDIQVGDMVISYNVKSRLPEICEVTKLLKPTHDDLIKYKFDDGREIICTQDHPFYVNEFNLSSYNPQLTIDRYEFTEQISKIHVGDTVFLNNESQTQIIEIEELDLGPTQTYIFEVSNNHNFFANGILTHNKSCFVAGSKVLMEDGIEKNIEEILVGDSVLSFNELESVVEPKNVTAIYSPTHDDLIELLLSDGTKIVSTYDHPYYVNNMELASYEPKWTNERYKLPTEVIKIEVGNQVHKFNGEKLEIISINQLERVQTQTYIISVEGNRNFYLNGILVHNK